MKRQLPLATRTVIGGTIAAITSAAALVAMARREGKAAVQPLNATSHWRHGAQAADVAAVDWAHTGSGTATHLAATLFWAAIFETWIGRRKEVAPLPVVRDAAVMAGVAAAVDYLATPRRFTPEWEFVLERRSMAVAYAAMGAGLAIGALASDRLAER